MAKAELFIKNGNSWMNYNLLNSYPVGAIYQSWNSTSPSSLFGGQWTPITGKFLYCSNSAGGTGGASSVTLNVNQMPSHSHKFRANASDGALLNTVVVTDTSKTTKSGADFWSAGGTVFNASIAYEGGGGNLTRICHLTSDAMLGEDTPNLFIGGER